MIVGALPLCSSAQLAIAVLAHKLCKCAPRSCSIADVLETADAVNFRGELARAGFRTKARVRSDRVEQG